MTPKSILRSTLAAAALAAGLIASSSTAQASELRCDSRVGGYKYCRVNTAGGVELRYQHSRYRCQRNDTWGYDRNGVWVSNGCSATFRVGRDRSGDDAAAVGLGILALGILGAIASQDDDRYGDGYPPPSSDPYEPQPPYPQPDPYDDDYGYDDPYAGAHVISCDSKNYKFRYCAARVDDYVELVRQRSKNACRFNRSWGFDRGGVWVKNGCRGDFAVY